MKPLLSILLAYASLAFLPARAASILTTYDGATTNGTASAIIGGSSPSGKAVGFTLPTGSDYTLDSISFALSSYTTGGAGNMNFISVALYSNDGSNTPGSQIATLTTTFTGNLPTTAASYTFTPTGSVTLSASNGYWIVITNTDSSSSSVAWLTSSGNTYFQSSISATYLGAVFGSGDPSAWTSTSGVHNALTVNATAISPIPEPSQIALVSGMALLVMIPYIRRVSGRPVEVS